MLYHLVSSTREKTGRSIVNTRYHTYPGTGGILMNVDLSMSIRLATCVEILQITTKIN